MTNRSVIVVDLVQRKLAIIVLVLAAGTFGLPTGWCCQAPATGWELKAAPARTCCGQKVPVAPSPVKPARSCCCAGESAAPSKAVSAHSLDRAAIEPALASSAAPVLGAGIRTGTFSCDFGADIPLRVLQCVWRC